MAAALEEPEEKEFAAPASVIDWEQFAGIKLFAWVGGFALFLGAGFFVKYSIDHGLLSPIIRVTLSFLLGGGCIGTGLYLKNNEKFIVTAHTLCAAGVAVLYADIFAASASYHFIGPSAAFALMSLVTAASFLLSVRMDSKYVALLGLIGGFITPPLLSTGVDRPFALFAYILLLDAGIAATVFRTGWTFLLPLSLAGTGIMEIGWFDKFFSPSKVMTGSAITALFAAFASAFITLAPSFSIEEKKAGPPCGFFQIFSIGLTAFMFTTGDLASRPAILFALLLSINALFAWHAYKSRYFVRWQSFASFLVFFIIAVWSADRLTPDLLGTAFAAYLVFSALNAALPVVNWKLRGEKSGELSFAGLYPLLGLALVLLAMFKQPYVSFFFWPVVLVLDLIAIVAGFLASTLWVAAACLVLTVAGGVLWLGKINQVAALGGFMAVFALFTVGFLALAVYLLRAVKENPVELKENSEVAKVLPYLTAVSPFLLIILAALKLKPDDPSMIFGFGLLMSAVMLTFANIYSLGALSLPALGGSFLLAAAWHTAGFEPARAAVPMVWYVLYMFVFTAFPIMFREKFLDSKPAWSASAASGLLFFIPIYDAVSRAMGKDLIGLLPAAFAALYFAALSDVIRHKSAGTEAQNFRLALTGGVALFFVTLIFPLQFDKEWLTLAWALEGAALVWLFGRVPHEGLKKWGYCLLGISFFRLTLNTAVFSYHPRQALPILNWYFYTYLTASAAMFTAARLWRPADEKIMDAEVKGVLMAFGAALLFLLMNIEIADFFSEGTSLTFQFSGNVARDMTYTLGWSVFAALLFGFGIKKASVLARKASIGIFAAAVLKLFLHDVWCLAQLYRVAAFMVTAVILILVSFLYQKHLAAEKATAKKETI